MDRPIVALMYDFDKTLCTKDMQEYTFIPSVGMKAEEFWEKAGELSRGQNRGQKMDPILAYLYLMRETAHAAHVRVRREDLVSLGRSLEFFPGVETWFDRIDRAGAERELCIEHYIISSGLREIIEGSSIGGKFREIFACEFLYDENDVICWPKNVVNYTTKTQFLFRINKRVLDISDDRTLNLYTPEAERPVPFRNMIYYGDGLTDVPCMKLVRENGGASVAVYRDDVPDGRALADALLKNGRVDYVEPADYSEGSPAEEVTLAVLDEIRARERLVRRGQAERKRAEGADS